LKAKKGGQANQIYKSVTIYTSCDFRILSFWAEIHLALLSQFYLLAELLIGKLAVKDFAS
jgi:hypothetical protein